MGYRILNNKKIAMLVAFRDFQDMEYANSKGVFIQAGLKVSVVSSEKGIAIGSYGGEAKVDMLLDDLNVSDFDAIVFIGGGGAVKYFDNDRGYEIANQAIEANKFLGAICISPMILAKAGVLNDKKATVWSIPLDTSAIKILKEGGAIYQDEPVVVDGKIITGNGPTAAEEFAQTLTEMLK